MFLSSDQQKNNNWRTNENYWYWIFLMNCLYHWIALITMTTKILQSTIFFLNVYCFERCPVLCTVHFYTLHKFYIYTNSSNHTSSKWFRMEKRSNTCSLSHVLGQTSFTFPSNAKTNCYHLILNVMVLVSGILLTTDNTSQSKH